MAILQLHNRLNPARLALQESTEIASVSVCYDGSLIISKGGGTVDVKESPEEIYEMIKERE
jgi:hypothetical protein